MSVFFIVVLCWLFPVIWLVVKLNTEGAPVYVQNRIGKDKKQFKCYKFRTMQLGTPERGTHETSSNSVTQVGAFLRRTKLDELPQLFNVLFGDMSLVGPRPCLPVQVDVINSRSARNVFRATPGITGLAQIRGIDMSNPHTMSSVDREYIATAGIVLDMIILLATFLGRGGGDKVAKSDVVPVRPADE